MKRLALLLSALGIVVTGHAGVLVNFASGKVPVNLHDAVKRDQQLEMAPVPGSNLNGGRLSWGKNRFAYAEPIFSQQKPLSEFDAATITLKAYAPAGCQVARVNLRLIDADNEVFQWDQVVNWTQGGLQIVSYQITPSNFKVSWGDKANKKIDFPVRLFGFGVDFKKDSGAGEIWLQEVGFAAASGNKVDATRPLCRFNGFDKWNTIFYLGTGSFTVADTGLSIKADAGVAVVKSRNWSLVNFVKPQSVTLNADLRSGDARVQLFFRDCNNRTASSAPVEMTAGSGNTVIELGDSLAQLSSPVIVERMEFSSRQKKFDLVLKKADSQVLVPAIDAVAPEVVTGTPVHVLKKGDEEKLSLQFANTADTKVNFDAKAVFEDYSGRTFTVNHNFSLAPHQNKSWQPDWQPDRFGIWWVTFILTDRDNRESVQTTRRSFCYIDPAGPTAGRADGFLFSICTHTERWGERDQELEVLAAALCGAKVIRTGVEWGGLQPQKNQWNWQAMDRLVKIYGEKGMELQYILAFTAQWAAPEEKQKDKNWLAWSRCAPDLQAWRQYASGMAKRYKDKIRYWEVWNEPDLNGFGNFKVEEYNEMVKAAYQEIKKVDPKLQVMTGGFATIADHPSRKDPKFQEKVLRGAKGYFDIHAAHEHCDFVNYALRVDGMFLPLREATGTKVPWYANETAISSMDGAEKMQAETLFKKLLFSWSRGAIGYTWYDLRNDGYDPKDGEHNFGMLTTDFYPKAVYPVYNALVQAFRGTVYDRQLDLGRNRWALVFKGKDRIVIPCWNETAAAAAEHLIIKTDAKGAERLDLMGNATPVPVVDGMTILELGAQPASLKLSGAAQAELAGQLVQIVSSGVAVPGKNFELAVKMTNPLAQPRDFQVKLTMPSGITAAVNTKTVRIDGGNSATASFRLKIDPNLRCEYGKEPQLNLSYKITDTPWQGALNIPVNLAVSIPAGDFNRKPDFVLNTREQVVTLCGGDPSKVHLIWRDANDLSAKLWLGSDGGNLLLRAEVTDDVHNQPYHAGNVWQGDNIQMALQLPGQTGCWEIGLSHTNDGKSEAFIWSAPQGFDAKGAMGRIKLETSRDEQGKKTLYRASIPFAAVGLTDALLKQGIRFNLLVNDNDGELREGWIHVAPGLGTNKNPSGYPFLIFE